MPLTRHQYGNVVLPCEDTSSESVFYSKWAHEMPTALQLGNAAAIHNIPRKVRTQARPLGDVETALPPPHKPAATVHSRGAEHNLSLSSDTEPDTEAESEPEEYGACQLASQAVRGTSTGERSGRRLEVHLRLGD